MIVQVEEYARGEARDPFLACALKPAEELTPDEQAFILRNFFMAHHVRMIHRYPRYGELFAADEARKNALGPEGVFGAQDFRDLQVLSQLAWFDEEFQEHDPAVRALIEKGRNFTLEDQALMGRKQREICALVIPEYRKLAAAGQIEISTTPFYHPILPLLCDSDIASVSHPHVPLPPRFSYPQDARLQLDMARDYIKTDLRRRARRDVAFRGLGFGSRARDRRGCRVRMGRDGQRRSRPNPAPHRRRPRSLIALTSGRSAAARSR